MKLRVLGPLDVIDDDGRTVTLGGPKERRLLAALAVHLDQPVSEARLCDALWGDDPPATATKTLQSYVSRVRKALGAGAELWIESVESGYALRCPPGSVDTSEVESLVGEAREAVGRGELEAAAELLRDAEARWRGPVMGDLADEPFALGEVARLEELRLRVVDERVEVELARGRHGALVGELEVLTGRYPLRERLWAARIVALYRSGRQGDALRAYQDLRRMLGEELGIDPSPELRALEEAVLLQSPDLDWRPSPGATAATPIAAPLPSGVVTFLLTDVEGSTGLWDTSPQEMDTALRRHDAIIAAAVASHGGTLLKSRGEGDSSFSVFSRASQAAAAAIAAQAALAAEAWPKEVVIQVRMAIHMGEAAEREQDYYGPAVNRVARLRALAAGGEILVSRSTADVLSDQVGAEFSLVELGERALKDLSRPEHVFALATSAVRPTTETLPGTAPVLVVPGAIAALPRRSPLRSPLPRVLAREGLCVGRGVELARLESLWDKAQDGHRQAALIGGEPGIGKTTLAATFARRVDDAGALVLYGRCDEDLGVSFQPFAEALRGLIAVVPDDQIRALRHHASHLTRLLPELGERLPDVPPPVPTDAEAERYSLFEAVVVLLSSVTSETPVLLVLDDLHWAAKPTLLLLRHILRAQAELRLLILATYRDTEVDRSHAFAEVLADMRRDVAVERLALAGLDRAGVQELVAATAGHDLDARALELSDALHREANGNPYFVAEVLNHLAESGAVYEDADGRWTSDLTVEDLGLPEGVRDVVGRRLSRLSVAANQAFAVGAVAGPVFELRLLEAIPEAGEPATILDALDEGVAAGLLTEHRGSYGFAHALVRQTLLEELSSTRRLRLHRRIAAALEDVAPHAVDALAFHFAEAAGADPEAAAKACDYALAAAHPARARSAYEEAITYLERGLEAVESTVPLDRTRRCDLLLELGELHRWVSSQPAAASDLGVRAAADARAINSTERLARAAVQAMQRFVGTPDPIGVALVEEALALLRDDDIERRVPLLLMLAAHRTEAEGRAEDGAKLSAEAFQLARLAPPGMAEAISSAWWWGSVDHRDEVTRWLSRVPPERRTAEQLAILAQSAAIAAFEVGDLSAADAFVLQLQELAEETHGWSPTYLWLAFSIARALIDGRWDEAEASLSALASHAGENTNALNVWAGNHFLLLRDRGEVEALLPVIEGASDANPGIPGFRAGHALLLAEQGRVEMASRVFAPLAGAAIATMPNDQVFPVTLAMVAEVAARLRDVESCEFAYRSMTKLEGRLATVAGTVAVGAADRYLGMLAATLGRQDDAQRRYEAAIDLEGRLGARPWLARTRTWYARMLLERATPGDAEQARDLLSTALTDADDLGMVVVAAEIQALL